MQPCDPRHSIHMIAHRYRRSESQQIRFYILEPQPEVIARLPFLLRVFFDKIPIRQRACLFIETYGNTSVQELIDKSSSSSLVYSLVI